MATPGQQPESDALSHLEDRIQRAVALVQGLRQEKEAALKEIDASRSALEDSRNTIGHIDQLGAS